jgi:hypothetical protein
VQAEPNIAEGETNFHKNYWPGDVVRIAQHRAAFTLLSRVIAPAFMPGWKNQPTSVRVGPGRGVAATRPDPD